MFRNSATILLSVDPQYGGNHGTFKIWNLKNCLNQPSGKRIDFLSVLWETLEILE